jgi:hypothetical protein
VNRLGFIITVMLALTAVYFLVTTVFKPSQPQVVVVRPSGAQNTPAQNTSAQGSPQPVSPMPVSDSSVCPRPVYLRVGNVVLCADVVYSLVKADNYIQIDFQGGVIRGTFKFVSPPPCVITTAYDGIQIPCRAQVLIQTSTSS